RRPMARSRRCRFSRERACTRSIRCGCWPRPTASRSDAVRLLETSEILNLVEYEKVREARRRELIELKRARRVPVGRYLSFVFENRETVCVRLQEVVR